MADPADMTDQFNTALEPQQEAVFQDWLKKSGRQQDLKDYDLRGAFASDTKAAANGHLPDTYKKPSHPTFSVESKYSTPSNAGGQWVDKGNNKWRFIASGNNLKYRSRKDLESYWSKVEPDNELVMPAITPYEMGQPQ